MKNKLKFLAVAFTFVLAFSLSANVSFAYSEVPVYVTNGTTQSYHDDAELLNGTTLVPLRGVFETLGASVVWNGKDKTITAKKGSTTVWLKVGNKTAKVNGKATAIAVAPVVKEGKTLVPLRFVSEALDATVNWNPYNNEVTIFANGSSDIPRSEWIGTYNNPLSGSGVILDLNIDKVTPTTITFTSIYSYRDYSTGNDVTWYDFRETRDAILISSNVAHYQANGCSFDLELYDGRIYVENMKGSCDHLNLVEYDGDEYTAYR